MLLHPKLTLCFGRCPSFPAKQRTALLLSDCSRSLLLLQQIPAVRPVPLHKLPATQHGPVALAQTSSRGVCGAEQTLSPESVYRTRTVSCAISSSKEDGRSRPGTLPADVILRSRMCSIR